MREEQREDRGWRIEDGGLRVRRREGRSSILDLRLPPSLLSASSVSITDRRVSSILFLGEILCPNEKIAVSKSQIDENTIPTEPRARRPKTRGRPLRLRLPTSHPQQKSCRSQAKRQTSRHRNLRRHSNLRSHRR